MTTKDLLETLNNTKIVQAYIKSQEPTQYPKIEVEAVDWQKRKKMKNKLFIKYILILSSVLLVSMVFALPLISAYPPYGNALLLGGPPMFFISASWMTGAWWAWDKARMIFLAVTFGTMPLRMLIGLSWTALITNIPEINQPTFILSMMLYWIVFTVVEVAMFMEFTQKIKCTILLEPNEN